MKLYVTIFQALARDALDKLDTIKMKAEVEKTHFKNMDEPVPDQLTEKLEQIDNLEDSIKVSIPFITPNIKVIHLKCFKKKSSISQCLNKSVF